MLTNAWGRSQRERALGQFRLDEAEFLDRHEMLVSSLERSKIGFDEYLDRTIFYRPRPFAREVFKDYVFSPDCCFIDDRALNLEPARQLGMHTIEMPDVEQLRRELRKLEVEI